MIKSCKYCGVQIRSCDGCGGPVIARTITELLGEKPYRAVCTMILCENPSCKYYGVFLKENAGSIESFVCDAHSVSVRKMNT